MLLFLDRKTVYLWNKALSYPEVYLVWNWSNPKVNLFFFFAFWFQYPAALMNLGAILHLNGKLQEAEANYLRALQLKPDDTITQSNLRKLWNIMEKQGLRTTSPWAHSACLPAICTPGLVERTAYTLSCHAGEMEETQGGCLLRERPRMCRTALLITPELCIHLRPAAFLRSIAHSLADATWYLDSLELSQKWVLSQEPCFFCVFFCFVFFPFITRALEPEVR